MAKHADQQYGVSVRLTCLAFSFSETIESVLFLSCNQKLKCHNFPPDLVTSTYRPIKFIVLFSGLGISDLSVCQGWDAFGHDDTFFGFLRYLFLKVFKYTSKIPPQKMLDINGWYG